MKTYQSPKVRKELNTNKLKKKKNEMNCVLLCKSYRSSILTYDCDSKRGKERRRVRETSKREKERKWQAGVKMCARKKNVITV